MRTLGLDPSLTNFGIALHDSESNPSCVFRTRIQTKPTNFVDFIDRHVYLRNELTRIVQEQNPDRIGIENSVFGSSQSEGMYAVYMLSMEVIKWAQKDVVLISPSTLKTFARLMVDRPHNWKMEKPDMIEAAMRFNEDKGKKWHDGEADAFLIALLASRWWSYHSGLLKLNQLTDNERHIFCGLHIAQRGKKAGKETYKGIEHSQGEKFFLWSQVQKENIGGKIQKERRIRNGKQQAR